MNQVQGVGRSSENISRLRLDRWLWYARFFKSRSMATRACAGRKIRLNSRVIDKPHHNVRIGDVLTFFKGTRVRIIRIEELGTRRGPASEAGMLYEDLSPEGSQGGSTSIPPSLGILHRKRSFWLRRRKT